MTPRVYIIGFNNQARADRALASIPPECGRVLIDNGTEPLTAPDGVEMLRGPGLFTGAANMAILDALDRGAVPIVCNDDIELEPGCIELLMEQIEAGAGIACPMQVDMAVPDRVIMGGTLQAWPSGAHRVGPRSVLQAESARDFQWLPFCVVAINPAMVREIGLLDTNLRMWFSDSDYSIRARQAGWSVMLDPRAIVRHEQGVSTSEHRGPRLDMIFVTDQAAFQRKWGGPVLEEYS